MDRLHYEFKGAFVSEEGELTGYASISRNTDRGNEVIEPGAYKNLDAFIQDGFGAMSHDWSTYIATVEDAREDDKGLYVRLKFHTTTEAQSVRRIVSERLERGKSVGMSIGYRVIDDYYDAKGVRHLTAIELFEASIAPVPMNPIALVASVKSETPSEEPASDEPVSVEPPLELATEDDLHALDMRLLEERARSVGLY